MLEGSREPGGEYDLALRSEPFDEREGIQKKDRQLEQFFCVYAGKMVRGIATFALPSYRIRIIL